MKDSYLLAIQLAQESIKAGAPRMCASAVARVAEERSC